MLPDITASNFVLVIIGCIGELSLSLLHFVIFLIQAFETLLLGEHTFTILTFFD